MNNSNQKMETSTAILTYYQLSFSALSVFPEVPGFPGGAGRIRTDESRFCKPLP